MPRMMCCCIQWPYPAWAQICPPSRSSYDLPYRVCCCTSYVVRDVLISTARTHRVARKPSANLWGWGGLHDIGRP
ncbi:hypothetical protein BDP81DRAFT_416694 [Colletotrichum phormii]|uniref:Uncharacterized protein n=1 Tax=Colletotrichum phormii TaxID=359342 RepID=A0AAJ0A1R4_9PEZI|nr:uncharacterized protein BDP81DRAFT_416694 [Colletotrichum phormii]KAK1654864.1 hypothetical protein BDP81DRAFT_416694 [Colletotrichum phormii]